ncbi:hypothetical protein MKEN_00907200 [Mycena kentingensis (nom. inval.)]|nr:hypothetical protein MKEN_00907200 [Mycena kentingensis (nom. inval.)]
MNYTGPPLRSTSPSSLAYATTPISPAFSPPPPQQQVRYGRPSQRQQTMLDAPQQQRAPPSPGLPSRPSQGLQRPPQQDFLPQQPLQRQPSAPNARPQQQYPPQQHPMPDARYKELPVQPPPQMQPMAPAFMQGRAPAPAGPAYSQSSAFLPSDSQSSLYTPSRSYSDAMLIRGKSDDELDKTDVFWRRFNASAANAQAPDAEKSSWLQKNEGKSSRYSRLMWIVGFFFVLLAAGGIAIGIFLSFRNNSSNVRPDTLGGSANVASAAVTAAGGGGGVATTAARLGGTTSSALHVSPTNTVA